MELGAIHSIRGSVPQHDLLQQIHGEEKSVGGSFADLFAGLVRQADESNKRSTELAEAMARGEPTDIHTVMSAVGEADLSFRLMLEVRNKLVDAYQEIHRIPV